MNIPLKQKIELIENKYIKEIFKESFDDNLINESLHTFNKQHELSEYIVGFFIECIKLNKDFCKIDITRFNLPLKNLELIIYRKNLINRVSAQINNIDTDGNAKLYLNVYIHIGKIFPTSEKFIFLDTKDAIMHELGHWFFILSKYNNSGVVDSTANDILYQEICQMLKNDNISQELYYILYALYSVFGNELNAFVSQCHSEIYNYLISQKDISIDSVKKALLVSDTYDTFKLNIVNLKQIMNSTETEKENIINEFNNNIINYQNKINDAKQFNKIIKLALDRNKEALIFCEQTAVDTFYQIKNR